MSIKIIRLTLKSLWNSEYTIFIKQIISIIAKYLPEKLHLSKTYNKLADFKPDLEKIKAQEQGNEISKLLKDLDSERDILFDTMVAQLKTLKKVDLPEIKPHVEVLQRFINIHGDDIADAPYNSETKRLNDLLADYNSKEDVKQAAVALNLKIFFDQISKVNTTFNEKFMQRTEEISEVEKIDVPAKRAEIDEALRQFYKAFEVYSIEYEDLDYQTPANELNELIGYYKAQLKARATRRKSGKDVSQEPPIEVPE